MRHGLYYGPFTTTTTTMTTTIVIGWINMPLISSIRFCDRRINFMTAPPCPPK
jgi:hypothetical protein